MCNKYNGYPNYQTWNASLWIDNDQSLMEEVKDIVRHNDNWHAEQILKQMFVYDGDPLADNSDMYEDLLNYALGQIDWIYIIENFREDENET